jgi:hypothetical protein
MVADSGIRVGGAIIEKLGCGLEGCRSPNALLGSKGAYGREKGVVHSTGIEQEGAKDFLDAAAAFLVKWWGVVRVGGKLDLGTIVGAGPGMGRVLFAGWGCVGKALEGALNISRHGDIAGAFVVVPVNSEATVAGAGPIFFSL